MFPTTVSLPPSQIQEIWTIDQRQEDQYYELLKANGISPSYANEVLGRQSIGIKFGDLSSEIIPVWISPSILEPFPILLKDYGAISVYYPGLPKTRSHLLVVLNRVGSQLSNISLEEVLSLREVVNTIIHLLHTQRKFPDEVIAQWNEPQPGYPQDQFVIAIIPSRPESTEVFNVSEKVEFNNIVLFEGKYPCNLPLLTQTEMQDDISFWKKSLQEEPLLSLPQRADSEPIEEWMHILTAKNKAKKTLASYFYEALCQKGINIQKNFIAEEMVEEFLVENKKTGCPFCDEKILTSQKVYETDWSYVLYNFNPSSPNFHFMILPKRHVRFSEKLNQWEIADMHFLIQKLTEIFEHNTHRTDIKILTQDGPSVGQTVAHTHTHVMLTPPDLWFMLAKMDFDRKPPLTPEEMTAVVEKMRIDFKK